MHQRQDRASILLLQSSAPRKARGRQGHEHEDELDVLVEEWAVNYYPEEVMRLMQVSGIGAGVVQTIEDLVDRDPQIKHRQFYQTVEHPEIGLVTCAGATSKLSKTPAKLRPAPCLGEHNEYICTQILGMSDEEFLELLSAGVLQ